MQRADQCRFTGLLEREIRFDLAADQVAVVQSHGDVAGDVDDAAVSLGQPVAADHRQLPGQLDPKLVQPGLGRDVRLGSLPVRS